MPFGLNLYSPLNPYQRGAKAGFALARFPQILANFFKLNASLVPRPVRAIRVTRGGLEPSTNIPDKLDR